ncbi:Dolichyl-diphosphooligosaccharide--protein glycosyltransferase subunit WBP1 [Hyaloraphidium curvatum]|nr:Dolichyl-diphosphooligosaccharide--protein glycosyltransferase subunit WBP1 [Hyaloraphidium curvatum]
MIFRTAIAFIALIAWAAVASAKSLTGNRVLVLLDDASTGEFSTFFDQLRDRGYQLDLKAAAGKDWKLLDFGSRAYDQLVLFAPRTNSLGDVRLTAVVDFVKDGGNLLVAASSDASDLIRDLVYEFGISLDDKGTVVVDHIGRNASSDENVLADHATIRASSYAAGEPFVSAAIRKGAPILYRGTAMKFAPNPLLAKVLTGSASAYSAEPRADYVAEANPFVIGKDIVLVGCLQALNNARVTVSGSIDMFTNSFLDSQVSVPSGLVKSGNAAFVEEISKWTFHERGVLHIRSVNHHKEGESVQPGKYRIKDRVVYVAEIAEFHDGKWRPFTADDIQFEAIMLDPYVRTTLKGRSVAKDATSREFEGAFQLPDQYGVFTFKLDYRRRGYTYIAAKETISVVQFRHNEYERYLTTAWPYYAGAFSTILATALFSIGFLYSA